MMLFLLLVLISSAVSDDNLEKREDAYERMSNFLQEYKLTGKIQNFTYFEKTVDDYKRFSSITDFDRNQVCNTCLTITERLLFDRLHGMNSSDFEKQLLIFCKLYTGENVRVCEGLVKVNTPNYLHIIDNTPNLTSTDICGYALQSTGCPKSSRLEWTIDIPPKTKEYTIKPPSPPKPFKILHISDIHYDPRYTPNKTNKCMEPICCQDDQPDANSNEDSCGYWSSYLDADVPWRTVVNALQQTQKHDYDFVYFTGDIIHHRSWDTTEKDNNKIFAKVLDAFNDYYKVPLFVVLGNHEAHPSNHFPEPKDAPSSSQWMYDTLFQKMSKWFNINEVKDTMLKGGYYTVSPKKGFRVIVLNNNFCNVNNLWLLNNPKDPRGQLQWLVQVLLEAERNDEKVHLLYHMHSGFLDFYTTWSREFNKIINRFSDTIVAHFNGHTHKDEFYIYYNISDTNEAINVGWNGGSIVPYIKVNPSFKILSVDDNTLELLDFEEWTYNLTQANLNPNKDPEWYKLYSFKEAFGVKSLRPKDIDKLVGDMTKKPQLLDQIYRYKMRESDVALSEGCDDKCKKALLCDMVITESGNFDKCIKIKNLYDFNRITD